MKKFTAISTFLITIFSFVACNSNQTADQCLRDETQRTNIISAIIKDSAYSKEMMNMMMNDDHCKNRMSQNMMEKPEMKNRMMDNMMNMCKSDSSICKMMMGKTMDMCEGDESKCKMMTNCMKSHTGVMKSVEGCCDMDKMMNKKEGHINHHQK
jgi:hypothetical protein